jgi:hypothetical protein
MLENIAQRSSCYIFATILITFHVAKIGFEEIVEVRFGKGSFKTDKSLILG